MQPKDRLPGKQDPEDVSEGELSPEEGIPQAEKSSTFSVAELNEALHRYAADHATEIVDGVQDGLQESQDLIEVDPADHEN